MRTPTTCSNASLVSSSPLSHKEAQLLKRSEKLEELWKIDEGLREWHASGSWKDDPKDAHALRTAMDARQELAREVREMGCLPWEFAKTRDNSWLCVQRQRVREK